jgi:sucrose phosphorylase
LISGDRLTTLDAAYTLHPYQSLWITNKVDSAEDHMTPDPLLGDEAD